MSSQIEVVVSGIGGVFPKALDLDEFKKILLENVNTVEVAKWAQNDIEGNKFFNNLSEKRHLRFDNSFFGIHGSQALYLDPMTRMFLEKTFEAVIDAGFNPVELRGKNIPVFIGSTVSESESVLFEAVKSGFGITGHSRAMMANRISYYLNINGPSYVMDANWNCGVQVLHNALTMIQQGMCDSAVVGATNLGVTDCLHWLMNERGLLSKDGITRAFDENADGYSRGDGVVVLYLQRADLAKRNYVSLLGANTIFGSRGGDLIDCDPEIFQNFLEKCYEDSGVNPKDIEYLEAYGCGIKDRDEMELSVVEKVFCKNRNTPLKIGSVKTNIGHTETASALMSLIKIIVAMETGIIPAHLNYNQPNSKIPALTNGKIQVVTKNQPWDGGIAAINSLAITSSYGHIIVRSCQQPKVELTTDLPLLLPYSTRTEEGMQIITDKVLSQSPDLSYNKLVHNVFSSNISGHLYRGYTMKASAVKKNFQHFSGITPPVWFVYSGMGSQWQMMGKELLKLPIFAEAVQKCHDTLTPKGVNLLKIITDDDPQIFENILNSFVGIAAIQIGLTDVLTAIGIQADGFIGHSVGELGCAYADKCLTAQEMVLSAYYRGKASLDAELIVGVMAAIGMGYSQLKSFCPETIDIACHNSVDSCTISGPVEDVSKFVDIIKSKGVFAKVVNVSNIAYHSRYIKPAAPYLLSYLKEIISSPKPRSSKWISTSVPQKNWNTELAKTVSPEYLTNNLLSSVLFEEGLPFIPNNAVVIEIAPHGLLQAILKRALSSEITNVPLTRRNTNCLEFLFNSLGELYTNGVDLNLSPLYPPVPRPVPRGTRSLCSLVQWEHGEEWNLGAASSFFSPTERTFDVNFSEYRVDNRVFIPPVLYFGFINEMVNKDGDIESITFEDLVFKNHIEVSSESTVSITILVLSGTGNFEVTHDNKTIIKGRVTKDNTEKLPPVQLENNKDLLCINKNNFYKELKIKGHDFQEEYKIVSSLNIKENGFKGLAKNTDDWKALVSSALQMHLFYTGELNQRILLPKYIQRVHIAFDKFKNTSEEPVLWFNSKTDILESNNGVHITQIKYEQLQPSNNSIKIENLKFIKHLDENLKDVGHGLNMCTKILLENLGTKSLNIIELKEKYTAKYLPYIENYLIQRKLEVKAQEINDIDYSVLQEYSLIIISGKFLNICTEIISKTNNLYLLCFPNNHSICMSDKYVTIAKFSEINNKFYLVKKTCTSPVQVLNIKDDELSYKNILMISNTWTSELKAMLRNKNSRMYLIFRTIPVEGITEFVTQIQNLEDNKLNLRFMFVLDHSAPECKPESEFYARVFEQDLVVQILKNGLWGSFVDVSETTKIDQSRTYGALMRAVNSKDFSSICKPNYLGLHTKDLTRIDDDTIPCEVGTIDFAGINSKGHQVMGFAQIDLDHGKLATDPAFVWPIPKNWTMCDAATVPYAYTMAYYTLFEIGNISKGVVVLVHAGGSEIGQAAVQVAFNYGCTVFTTVANEQQKAIMMKMMPEIHEENILNSETTQFEISILDQTKGQGVNVILNCLPGDRFQASKRLLALHGRFVQLGTSNILQHATMGMQIFLKNTAMYGVPGQHLLTLHQDIKLQLKEMISKDIERGIVRPIARRIFTENRVDDSLRYLRSSSVKGAAVLQVNNINYENIIADSRASIIEFENQESYLIYADADDSWLSLIEWLVKKGAKRIIIANSTNENKELVTRFLSLIQQNNDTEIIISNNNAYTIEDANKLLNEINNYGYITEAFIFAMENEQQYNIIENMDAVFSQYKLNTRMVCFLGKNKDKSYFRKNGFPVCNILWDDSYNLQDVIKNFDVILNKEDNINVILKSDIDNEEIVDDKIAQDDSMFLPNSLKTLKHLGQKELQGANLVQLTSHTVKELRECPPVFLVPGLSGQHCPTIRQFVAQLMYPVFCVDLPAASIQDDVVADLAQQILQVKKSKVYKLIGVSWGGILAIEIAKQIENLGKKVELFLIDGAPKVIHNFTNNFNKTGVFNTALLKQIIEVDGKNLETILSSTYLSKFDYKDMMKSLSLLKNHIEYSNFYKPLPNKINGPTILILPETTNAEDSLSLNEHCEKIEQKIMKGNHLTILLNLTMIDFINDNLV